MFNVVAFIYRKPGLTFEQFRDHYEHHHVPLVLSIAKMPDTYVRRYIDRAGHRGKQVDSIDFDVITEIGFASEQDYRDHWLEPLVIADTAKAVREDEETFIDRTRTISCPVQMFASEI